MSGFYDEELRSFSVEGKKGTRFSITSTACAAEALWLGAANSDASGDTEPERCDALLERICGALLGADWREDDLLQVSFVVYATASLAARRPVSRLELLQNAGKFRIAVERLAAGRVRLRDSWKQTLSVPLQFWLAQALLAVAQSPGLVDDVGIQPKPLALALSRSHEVARHELCRQIAYEAADDSSNFDCIRLAFALLAYQRVGSAKALVITLWGDDQESEEFTKAGGPDEIDVNQKLVIAGLRAIFNAQQSSDGLWPSGQAIYSKSRRAYDLGNSFVFSPSFVGSLLAVAADTNPRLMTPYLPQITKLAAWIQSHDIEGRGWRSNHLSATEPAVAWSSAQVLTFAHCGLRVIRRLLNDDVLTEFGGEQAQPVSSLLFESLLDSDLSEDEDDTTTKKEQCDLTQKKDACLKAILWDRFIAPRQKMSSPINAAYSALLFGPPGTAKTTIAKSIARALGYGFVVIDTATFLADGLPNVMRRVAYVFGRLKKLRNCIILFDEIEEFALDRRSELATMSVESRMLTTAMLTQLNDLRQARRSIFFIATNRLDAFDAAIIRPGRIDLLLFVGTPALESRVARFHDKFKKRLTLLQPDQLYTSSQIHNALATFEHFLHSVWKADAQFFNFMESERFADSALEVLLSSVLHNNTSSTPSPTANNYDDAETQLHTIFSKINATVVLRDAQSRQDFIEMRRQTRL
eukprot:CAMPEP_0197310044 /NCGR_PEP_ID=MMETSP0891-20130614/8665_1 /TAXON_ID=44058 ORGANISM="Aureoumbra lagunensis, Strain CCMP1510" /NCGR_SAMPLE_ID=MMETSP0891 /ASSEMBLY_ACC=CAM_ASM_000534 /LENGTH=696 /DNA_ID=CAMNT_0042795499 /DNA_START=209 /DNA_END=2299 /DNA_ORIENTATION=+